MVNITIAKNLSIVEESNEELFMEVVEGESNAN